MNEKFYDEKAVYLQMAELIVLLQGQGINDLVIFEELANVHISDSELANACSSLIRNGLLHTDEKQVFLLREDLKPMFEVLKYSRNSGILYGQLMSVPMQVLYFYNGHVVVLQQDELRKQYFRLSYQTMKIFMEQLYEYEFLMQTHEQDLFYQKEEVFQKLPDLNMVEQDENLLLLMQFFRNKESGQRLWIYRCPMQDLLLWQSETEDGCEVYTRENLEKKVLEFSNGFS